MKTKNQNLGQKENITGYQCTMKCEGDKVYDHPGNCPQCNMKLAPVGDNSSHGHQQHKCC